jgi:ATP-dependent Lhr-like helicase
MNAGVIVEQPLLGRALQGADGGLGTVEEGFASTLTPGDHFFFAGLSLEVERIKDTDIIVHASKKSARIVTYGGSACRCRRTLPTASAACWPTGTTGTDSRRCQRMAGGPVRTVAAPRPHQLLVETFPHEGRHYMVAYSFEGWNAHQSSACC